MHSLAQLHSGELKGVKKLSLREKLTEFPEAIFELRDSLEILDLTDNLLSALPANLAELTKLKILFCSNNLFTEVPEVLATCPNLEMIGFKSNQISRLAENTLPLKTRWLILTDNKLSTLPESFGRLSRLQKCMLAGNQLSELPSSLSHCQALELIRLSANQFERFPDALLTLPKLAWIAFSGNPFNAQLQYQDDREKYQCLISMNQLDLHEKLGEGASGHIHKATLTTDAVGQAMKHDAHIAVKLFKGSVTSDGYPEDELDICIKVGEHPNLVRMLAPIKDQNQSGMAMQLIPEDYRNLGNPPSLQTCTRDTFETGFSLSIKAINKILTQVADTMTHLHLQGVSHGDLYAHNILINPQYDVLLGDFGAASQFDSLPERQQRLVIQAELRAFANLAEDLVRIAENGEDAEDEKTHLKRILWIIEACRHSEITDFKGVLFKLTH